MSLPLVMVPGSFLPGKSIPPGKTLPQGCRLTAIVPNNRGYIRFKRKGYKKLKLHHIVCIARYGPDSQEIRDLRDSIKEASHLCHEKACVVLEHVVVEDIDTNGDRKRCKKLYKTIYFQRNGAWQKVVIDYECQHQPRCIRRIVVSKSATVTDQDEIDIAEEARRGSMLDNNM